MIGIKVRNFRVLSQNFGILIRFQAYPNQKAGSF